jgi:hypothetical protein
MLYPLNVKRGIKSLSALFGIFANCYREDVKADKYPDAGHRAVLCESRMRAVLDSVAWGLYNVFRAMQDPPSNAWTVETTLRLQVLLKGMPSIMCREWHRPRPVRLPLLYTERWVAVRRALDRGRLRQRRRKQSAEPTPEVSINTL